MEDSGKNSATAPFRVRAEYIAKLISNRQKKGPLRRRTSIILHEAVVLTLTKTTIVGR